MTFVSYAQNFEDVMLWRALGDIEGGRYLDIGAQDPIADSVSLAFYNAGWRGIHVEPTPAYAALLREARPDEQVIQAAVSDADGPMPLFEFPSTGLSTGVPDVAQGHVALGFEQRPIIVPTVRLDHLLELANGDLHWLKIDVEGMESQVLRSWGGHPLRPWILVIESTQPNTKIPTHESWIAEVTGRGYEEVYFDGLSRYFLHADHLDRKDRLTTPPNLFDGFQVTPGHVSVRKIVSDTQREQEEVRASLDQLRNEKAELAAAKTAAEAIAAELPQHAAAARAAEAGQRAAIEALAAATETHAEALAKLWRERMEHERSLHQTFSAREAEFIRRRAEQEGAHRAELERMAALDEDREHSLAAVRRVFDGALAQSPGAWHRLGRFLGVAGLEPARLALATWCAHRPMVSPPALIASSQSFDVSDSSNPYLRASSLQGLLDWHDIDFVRCAYVTILGRQPDEDGEAYYCERLRRGHPKMELLWQLRHSSEGKLHDPGIAGLDRALRQAHWERMPVIGRVVSAFTGGRSNNRSVRVVPKIQGAISKGRPETTVDDLLAFHDEEFVRRAYVALLGRPVDPEGLSVFVGHVRAGMDRRQILAEIYRSPEGQKYQAQIIGIEAATRPYLTRRRFRFWSSRHNVAENQRRHMRSMINELYRIETRHRERFAQIEASHAERLEEIEAARRMVAAQSRRMRSHDVPERREAVAALKAIAHRRVLCASEPRDTRPRFLYYFVDHTVLCPVNTGLQRLVRQLGRCLVEGGEAVRFVKWDADNKSFVLVSQTDLEHLAKWNGPVIPDQERYLYSEEGGEPVTPPAGHDLWLLVPEVPHVTYQQQPVTLDAIMAGKALGAKVAFIYYDAIPLRLPDYRDGAPAHEKYMQALLLADAIMPISRRSAAELREFFIQRQRATALPQIEALHLPGESLLAGRVVTRRLEAPGKIILAVGSIEPRKNQLKLISAFEEFSATPDGQDWRLVLAGHMRADVAAEVNAAIERNGRIDYVPHPLDDELDELYRSAAFTVFPSVEEGFGLPILESLWYGVPCICANFGAMAEVAEGGGCLTIDTRSAAELSAALAKLAANPVKLADLSAQAVSRPMTRWSDYANAVRTVLARVSDPTRHLHIVYFWVDDTCRNPHNSGIQRLVRQFARALLAQGYNLVPVKWDRGRLSPVSEVELAHLGKWNGPPKDQWGDWLDPADSPDSSWLIIPEIVHGQIEEVRQFAVAAGMRCAAVFYDAIPYKMKDIFGPVFAGHHESYMLELSKFDKVFSISHHSHNDLKDFLRGRRIRTPSFDHRFEVSSNLGPLTHDARATVVKKSEGPIHILSVISIEPRKNPLILLKALARASAESTRDIKLTIVGRRIPSFETLAEEIEAFADEHDNFTWLQDLDDNDLARLYAAADFTVFPSLEEGFGLPIVESLWHGRPCIVHDSGAMAEVSDGGGCVSVDMRNVDALADAIALLASNDSARAALAEAAIRRPIPTWNDFTRDVMRSIAQDRLDDAIEQVAPTDVDDIQLELPNLDARPLLSICISTYNRGAWLEVNLRNLFRQIPGPTAEIEVLVVDNASDDTTEEVVKPYLDRPDFRFLRNAKNVGMLGNLTVTAHEARGEYIWILGDDDLVKDRGVNKVVEVIKANPGVALIYPNYAFTQEKDPKNVGADIQKFLDACPSLTPACDDVYATVKHISTNNENLFTAIYCLIFRRDHALRAYSQDTSGRPFSTMRTSIPTTYYVLHHMMDEPAYWIGDLLLVVNFNVSWDKYASLQILERVPEAQDLAERLGADPQEMDRWRENLMPGFVHYWRELLEDDPAGNAEFFSPERVVMRMKHLDAFAAIAPQMAEIYAQAMANGHHAATMPARKLFNAFN